jgi:hypothetical protein
MERCRIYYKGEGDGFPQVRAVVSLVCPCCPWLVLTPKVLQLHTNHLVWVLCKLVWVSEAYQLFLVPSRSSNTPLYPSKCCELGNMPRFLLLPMFFTWTHIWVFQRVGSVSFKLLFWGAFSSSNHNYWNPTNIILYCVHFFKLSIQHENKHIVNFRLKLEAIQEINKIFQNNGYLLSHVGVKLFHLNAHVHVICNINLCLQLSSLFIKLHI